jgi:putative hydrolase of the HAD superfamily
MPYELIIFDLGNVVLRFDHNISAAKIAGRFGLDRNRVYELFFDSELTKLHDEGKISSRAFVSRITGQLGVKMGFDDFKQCWNDIFFANKGMAPLIKRLKRRYKVYLMSNTNRLHFEFIKDKFRIIGLFDKLVLSYKVRAMKPDPRIYRYALKVAGTAPESAIYIDDRKDLIELSRPLGMRNLLFTGVDRLKKDLKKLSVDT